MKTTKINFNGLNIWAMLWVVIIICSTTSVVFSYPYPASLPSDYKHEKCQGPGKVAYDPADVNSLRVVNILFRHGDRTPIYLWPTMPYNLSYFPEGWGQLTPIGKEQLLTLGKYFRQRYGAWIAKKFTPEAIYVLSSDLDRTIMTADACMVGLFPPPSMMEILLPQGPQLHYVPVHVLPQEIDNEILFSASCPWYTQLFTHFSNSQPDNEFNGANQELYRYLSEQTGLHVTNYTTVYSIYDTLFIMTCHGLPLPKWAESVFPDKMIPSVVRYFKTQTWTDNLRRLFVGPLWTHILGNIEKAPAFSKTSAVTVANSTDFDINAPPPPPPNLYMFSGHDNTIAGLLDSVGALEQLGLLTQIPAYASSLMLEVHERGNSGNFYVKLFFRGDLNQKAQEIQLRCPSLPCSYSDFLEIVGKYKMGPMEWKGLCAQK